jgi:hypothetical protein
MPPMLESRTGRAQKVRTWEVMRQASLSLDWEGWEAAPGSTAGVMSGTGATPRSGLVRVFARRIAVPEDWMGRVVGMGTSLELYEAWSWKRMAEAILPGE